MRMYVHYCYVFMFHSHACGMVFLPCHPKVVPIFLWKVILILLNDLENIIGWKKNLQLVIEDDIVLK